MFYLLGYCSDDETLRLYQADDLLGEWTAHPSSPVRTGEHNDIRPGGRPELIDDQLIYFIQDHSEGYGTGLIAYQIELLTKTEFKDVRLENNPILYKFGMDWAENGMHHLSFVKMNEMNYFCVVDGVSVTHKKQWRFSFRNWQEFITPLSPKMDLKGDG